MSTASETIDAAICEATSTRALVTKVKAKQVRGADLIAAIKSTGDAWFKKHRKIVAGDFPSVDLSIVDGYFRTVLDSTTKFAARTTYLTALKDAKKALVALRAAVLVAPPAPLSANTDDLAPDFSPLAGNQEIREILTRRWHECCKCVNAGAHLAAIVMMGGLLEALFVARANKLLNKGPLVNAGAAPKDKHTGKTINYQDWMLDSYIKVGFELQWITESAKDVADVLKEYRNYIHPEKELRHGVVLSLNDSSMFWQVTKALVRQLLLSVATQ